jgi:hypothetical protein
MMAPVQRIEKARRFVSPGNGEGEGIWEKLWTYLDKPYYQ